jgi:hypothetical protein
MSMSPKVRVWLRRGALVAAVPLALWLVLALTLQTGWGRAKAGELIAGAVSDAIAGRMRIDEVLSIGLTTAHVRGLAFEDPRGRDVVHIDDAQVHMVLSALLSNTVRFDRARARGVEVCIFTGELNSTSIEDAFGGPDPDADEEDDDEDGVKVMLDHVAVEDATVRVLTGASIAMHVSQAGLRLDHDLSRRGEGERPTDVVLSDVYANFFMDGREAISGTDVRATGSIFDLRARVCHPRGLIAMRVVIGGAQPRLTYWADRPLLNIALRMVDRFSDLEMDSAPVDLSDVPRCGPPPEP